jgi:hypothetical protein
MPALVEAEVDGLRHPEALIAEQDVRIIHRYLPYAVDRIGGGAVWTVRDNVAGGGEFNSLDLHACGFNESIAKDSLADDAAYGALYRLAPNTQYAFEIADEAFSTARKTLRQRLDEDRKRREGEISG